MNDNHDAMDTLADELERIGNAASNGMAVCGEQRDNQTRIELLEDAVSTLSRAILLISQAVRSVK